MKKRPFLLFVSAVLAVAILFWGVDQGLAQPPKSNEGLIYKGKITPAEKKAAAQRAKALGLKPGVAGTDPAAPAGLQAGADGMAPAMPSGVQPGEDSNNISNKR
jgi:hypothetical protein